MISSSGRIIIIGLIIAIAAGLLTMPRKKVTSPLSNVPSPMEQMTLRGDDGELQAAAPARQPAPRLQPPVLQQEAAVAAADFDLLRDRYGRVDPFEPLFELPGAVGLDELVELPAISPLPPLILSNPPSLVLSAIAMNSDGGMAVINGEILREGDVVEGFIVGAISVDRVELYNNFGDRAILRIKHELRGSFDIGSGTISNIEENKAGAVGKAKNPVGYYDAPGPLPALKYPLEEMDYPDLDYTDSESEIKEKQ